MQFVMADGPPTNNENNLPSSHPSPLWGEGKVASTRNRGEGDFLGKWEK